MVAGTLAASALAGIGASHVVGLPSESAAAPGRAGGAFGRALMAPMPAGAKVTRASSADLPIGVPALLSPNGYGPTNPYPAAIRVAGFARARITDADVVLHGFGRAVPGDVQVLVVSPRGGAALVTAGVGNDPAGDPAVHELVVRLDDEAATPLPADGSLANGTFRPNNHESVAFPDPAPTAAGTSAPSVFDGARPNGARRGFVHDKESGPVGSIDRVTIEITARFRRRH